MKNGAQDARDITLKAFGALEVKDAAKGEVEAIIATLNVVDHDRDVLLPGAIPEGAKVKISWYGHDAVFGDMPVGKGTLEVRGDQVVAKGRYFLSTTRGADAFATLKELGSDQEWSFGFRVMERADPPEEWVQKGARQMLVKVAPFEVSPVMFGAGIGTQTLAMKGKGGDPDPEEGDEEAKKQAELEAAEAKAKADQEEEARVAERLAQRKENAELFDRFQRNLKRFKV